MRFQLAVAALTVTLAACGKDDSNKVDLVTCGPGVMKLEGTIAGTAVTLQSPTEGGFSQDNSGGDFQTQLPERGSRFHDAAVFDVRLKWSGGLIDDRHSMPATGDVWLPTGAPAGLAGQTYCTGAGSIVAMVGEELRFGLLGLRTGAGCTMPVEGELRGCWHGSQAN